MSGAAGAALPVLVVRAGDRLAALPLGTVRETMRPLPLQPVGGAPAFVAGMSVLRAEPVPVVILDALLGGGAANGFGRFVSVQAGRGRPFLLAVDEVIGVRRFATDALEELPPLLGAEARGIATAVTLHDERLVTLLDTAHLIPGDVWRSLEAHRVAS
jgi:purine-binding chemotaxis protein CheW